jgi:hypothetical protein
VCFASLEWKKADPRHGEQASCARPRRAGTSKSTDLKIGRYKMQRAGKRGATK